MKYKFLPRNRILLDNARELRREMTLHEKHLWYDFLQHYPVKIYKQHIIGNYIADFYCSAAKLVIELDGNQHNTNEHVVRADRQRDAYMKSLGIEVVRFSNLDIEQNFNYICEWIDHTIQERMKMK